MKANQYNATVRAETDTLDSNLRKLGLSPEDIKRSLTCDPDVVRAGSLLPDFCMRANPGLLRIRYGQHRNCEVSHIFAGTWHDIPASMMLADELNNMPAPALRRLARELRHEARTSGINAYERRLLLIRAAHAAELAEQKEPWLATRRCCASKY